MIQFNLLPDVKLDYIKAQRSRRLVVVVSVVVSLASVALLVLLLSVAALQKKHLSDLSSDITSKSATLQKKPDILGDRQTAGIDPRSSCVSIFDRLSQTAFVVDIEQVDPADFLEIHPYGVGCRARLVAFGHPLGTASATDGDDTIFGIDDFGDGNRFGRSDHRRDVEVDVTDIEMAAIAQTVQPLEHTETREFAGRA